MCVDDCPLPPSRREFLRDAGLAVAGVLASLGASRQAQAMPLSFIEALRRAGDELVYPIPAVDGATIDVARDVIIVRHQGSLYAFRLQCPHQRTELRWSADASMFICPKHKSRYQPDGTFISGKATRGMDRLGIRRREAELLVDTATVHRQDQDAAGWAAAVVAV